MSQLCEVLGQVSYDDDAQACRAECLLESLEGDSAIFEFLERDGDCDRAFAAVFLGDGTHSWQRWNCAAFLGGDFPLSLYSLSYECWKRLDEVLREREREIER